MKDSEFLAEIKARAELEAMGYRWVTCDNCEGVGTKRGMSKSGGALSEHLCLYCDGKGKVWKESEPPPSDGVTHYVPTAGSSTTVCCGRQLFELPRTDRLTNDATLVTCPKHKKAEALAAWKKCMKAFLEEQMAELGIK